MEKFILYQLIPRSFGSRKWTPGGSYESNGSGKFNNITDEYLASLKNLSVDAIWYTGVLNHATRTSFEGIPASHPSLVKGEAGSPYAIRDYYDLDPALAENVNLRSEEFQALIERTHKAGIKVITDIVPNHVAREYHSEIECFTSANFYVAGGRLVLPVESDYVEEPAFATGNDCFSNTPSEYDWYDTVKLNYDNRDTWNKMLNIILFWASKGIDGFRFDMAEMVPVEFYRWAFQSIKDIYPDIIFIAEIYNKDNYRTYFDAGFNYIYNKSCFYDALRDIALHYRPAHSLTSEWQFLGDMEGKMLNFLENHDEQRLASDFFLGSGFRGIAPVAAALLFDNAPFMIYAGQEYGERGMLAEGFSDVNGRSSIFDYCTVPTIDNSLKGKLSSDEKKLYKAYCELFKIARQPLFSKGMNFDLMYANFSNGSFNPERQFAFLRHYEREAALIVINFDSVPVSVAVNIPEGAGDYFGMKLPSLCKAEVEAYGYVVVNL
ncbi:MAG: alpha-amylase [Bacteroidales bacterium]|nr:alpha-amylase [Bacteroidales bacterium]